MPLPVCRVCLSSNISTVYSLTDIQLLDIYEKLTQLSRDEKLPNTLCYYCCWQLQQYCKLRSTALNSNKMLRKVQDCNTKNGLRFIHALPKSRHLIITTLKSLSFNGESNETLFEYPRQMMMTEKDHTKPIHSSLTDYIPENPSITTLLDTKPVCMKSLTKLPLMKQYRPIAKQVSLQCLLTGKPGLVITKQKKPLTRNTAIGKQEAGLSETKHETRELHFKTQAKRQEKQDLGTGIFNITEKHEMNLKQVNQTCKIEAMDDKSLGDRSEHLELSTVSEMDQPNFYNCSICKKLFKTEENLLEHLKTHKIIEEKFKEKQATPCPICNKYVMNIKKHTNVHKERRYKCDICGHMSRTKNNLVDHLRVHTDEPEIVCKVCNKGFKHKSSYVYHKNIHTGERPYTCHICGGKYKQSGQVRAHIRFVHEGYKGFCCDVCGKKYIGRHKLMIHLNTHSNIKPFSCDKCQKEFVSASVMRRHVALYCKRNQLDE